MQDRLGVAPGRIAVPPGLQLGAQRRMVVGLAVVDDHEGAVLVAHRLRAAVDVEDRQAAVRQTDRSLDPLAGTVRAAMPQGLAHPPQALAVDGVARIEPDDAGDAAHAARLSPRRTARRRTGRSPGAPRTGCRRARRPPRSAGTPPAPERMGGLLAGGASRPGAADG